MPKAVKDASTPSKRDALIVIDMQRGFTDGAWGTRNNPSAERQALRLLAHWRDSGRPVIFVRHDSSDPHSPLLPGTRGNEFMPGFEPREKEWLVAKRVHSAFIGTGLESRLRDAEIAAVTLVGLTTDQCVSTTARMACNLGFRTTVAEDACACFGQRAPDGRMISAEAMHRAHITTLHSEFARVARAGDLLHS